MTEREAFEGWWKEYEENCSEGMHISMFSSWQGWQAACKWQRERDADICNQMILYTGLDCADAILNQGEEG